MSIMDASDVSGLISHGFMRKIRLLISKTRFFTSVTCLKISKRIVILGLGTGGLHAIRSAQRQDRSVEITVVERRSYDMFSPCGLPYAVGKRVESFEALKHTIPTTRKLKKLLRHEAKRIDVKDSFSGGREPRNWTTVSASL